MITTRYSRRRIMTIIISFHPLRLTERLAMKNRFLLQLNLKDDLAVQNIDDEFNVLSVYDDDSARSAMDTVAKDSYY